MRITRRDPEVGEIGNLAHDNFHDARVRLKVLVVEVGDDG